MKMSNIIAIASEFLDEVDLKKTRKVNRELCNESDQILLNNRVYKMVIVSNDRGIEKEKMDKEEIERRVYSSKWG